jgi:hypothetical protein
VWPPSQASKYSPLAHVSPDMSRGSLSRVRPGRNDDLAARMDALKCRDESVPVSEADDSEGAVG